MSETQPGPQWWQASDGKWYPPETHPNYVPGGVSSTDPGATGTGMTGMGPSGTTAPESGGRAPAGQGPATGWPTPGQAPTGAPTGAGAGGPGVMPPGTVPLGTVPPGIAPPGGMPPAGYHYGYASPGSYPQYVGAEKTSGLAVASLVLSIVWIGGIGSILAVIFALMARKRISRSGGRLGGSGLSLAGLIVGIVGIVGAVGLWVTVGVIASSVQDVTVRAGQTVHVQGLLSEGVRTVTVYGVQSPAESASSSVTPDNGSQFAVADVRICAGDDGAHLVLATNLFELGLADGTDVSPDAVVVKTPAFVSGSRIPANACQRGYVNFQIPDGAVPTKVTYQGSITSHYTWLLSGS